jgi:hypothetical protein
LIGRAIVDQEDYNFAENNNPETDDFVEENEEFDHNETTEEVMKLRIY